MAGYSGTPLPKKLGIKPGARLALAGAPEGFERTLGELPDGVVTRRLLGRSGPRAERFDVIVCFARSEADLARDLPGVAAKLDPAGGLWIGWPKKSSGFSTDLSEAEVRARGLGIGLVDNKVARSTRFGRACDSWFVWRIAPKAIAARADGRHRDGRADPVFRFAGTV